MWGDLYPGTAFGPQVLKDASPENLTISCRGASSAFHQIIDSSDSRPVDTKLASVELDKLVALVKRSDSGPALALARRLLQSGEVSTLALETVLVGLYDQWLDEFNNPRSLPLVEAMRLSRLKQFAAAESQLKQLVEREPRDLRAALWLMRLYTCDMHRPGRAYALLAILEKRFHALPGFGDYARQAIARWLAVGPVAAPKCPDGIESLLVPCQANKAR